MVSLTVGSQQTIEKIQEHLTDWKNLTYQQESIITELTAEKDSLVEKMETATKYCQDADEQLIKVVEKQKAAAKDLHDSRSNNHKMSEELVPLHVVVVDKRALDGKFQLASERLAEIEETVEKMKAADKELVETQKYIINLEKVVRPLNNALVPENPASPTSFLDCLKAVPRQLKAYVKESSETCLIHVLSVIKSRWSGVNITKSAEGVEPSCSEEDINKLQKEA